MSGETAANLGSPESMTGGSQAGEQRVIVRSGRRVPLGVPLDGKRESTAVTYPNRLYGSVRGKSLDAHLVAEPVDRLVVQ